MLQISVHLPVEIGLITLVLLGKREITMEMG